MKKMLHLSCLILMSMFYACQSPVEYFKNVALDDGQKNIMSANSVSTTKATREVLMRHDFKIKEDIRLPNGIHSIIAERISTELIEKMAPFPSGYIRVLIDAKTDNQTLVTVAFKTIYRKAYKTKITQETARATVRFFEDIERRVENLSTL